MFIRKSSKGFTLVELLISLSVIAILVGIIMPSIRGFRNEAYISQCESNVKTIESAVKSYYRNHNYAYPNNITTDLTSDTPNVIREILSDPFKTDTTTSPNTYGYIKGTEADSGDYYIIYSKGGNGQIETSWCSNDNKAHLAGDDKGVTNAAISTSATCP